MMRFVHLLALGIAFNGCKTQETKAPVPTLFTEVATASGIDFRNDLEENEAQNIVDYLYFYNGAGVAVADFNRDGLEDIYFVRNQGKNALYWNEGNWSFKEGAKAAGVEGQAQFQNGVSVVDLNSDGFPDLSISAVNHLGWRGHHEFYLNNGDGTFTESAQKLGLDFGGYGQQTLFFDADNDGDQDLYVLRHSARPPGEYHRASQRNAIDNEAGDLFYRNTGSPQEPHFEEVTQEVGVLSSPLGYGLSIIARDFNSDGYLDIYVANDFHENDYLYLNRNGARFEWVTEESFRTHSKFTMGIDAADLNGDGHQDLFTLDMKPWDEIERKNALGAEPFHIHKYKRSQGYLEQFPKNSLHTFRANMEQDGLAIPVFEDQASLLGVESTDWSWGVLLEDFDGDGYKDIFVTNGIKRRPNDLDYIQFLSDGGMAAASDKEVYQKMPPGQVSNRAFRGGDTAPLLETSAAWGLDYVGTSNGSAIGDFDNDGRWDIVVNNLDGPALLYKNTLGSPTTVADFAGYNVRYRKRIDAKAHWNQGTRSWLSHSTARAAVDDFAGAIIVEWPHRSAEVFTLFPGEVNTLEPGKGQSLEEPLATVNKSRPLPATDTLDVAHKEDAYTSFVQTPLLIEGVDELGPAGAYFDGAVFVGASAYKAPCWWDPKTGDTTLVWSDRKAEDVDAQVITLGNGKQALVVVTGGSAQPNQSSAMRDRIYLKAGGESTELVGAGTNASCAAIVDVNGDGIDDLFIGERCVWNDYGAAPKNALYLGAADGSLTPAEPEWLDHFGMITDAVTGDVTGDGRADLIVATDWNAIQLVDFTAKRILPQHISKNGWWRHVALADLDGDNDLDIIAGGFGRNHGITVSDPDPIALWIKDFDGNGDRDFVYEYTHQGKRYPLFGRDELIKESVQYRKQFLKNRAFAGKTFDELFDNKDLSGAELLQVSTTESAVLWNQFGNFQQETLPDPFQQSPIYASWNNGSSVWLAGGADAVHTSIGRQESFCGGILTQEQGGLRYGPMPHVLRGSVRQFLPVKDQLLVLLNDGPVLRISP
jgi:hypothetical protein